jgi:hypothetical protein
MAVRHCPAVHAADMAAARHGGRAESQHSNSRHCGQPIDAHGNPLPRLVISKG